MHKSIVLMLAVLVGYSGGSSVQSSSTSQTSQVINGIAVPPEPNPVTNNATLLGVDSNNNGVRDDVDRQIATLYGTDSNRYAAALQAAKSDQAYLAANGEPVKSTAATSNAVIAGACISQKFGADWQGGSKAINDISAISFNTQERMAAYRATSSASREVMTIIPRNPCQ